MIKNATFTTVWDNGYEITTNCKVNMKTKEVFDIETVDVDVDILIVEYVTVDGIEYFVFNINGHYRLEEVKNISETAYENLKRKVFDAGVNAIEDLLGCELEFDTDEDLFEAMDDTLDQMPEEDIIEFYNKYCL